MKKTDAKSKQDTNSAVEIADAQESCPPTAEKDDSDANGEGEAQTSKTKKKKKKGKKKKAVWATEESWDADLMEKSFSERDMQLFASFPIHVLCKVSLSKTAPCLFFRNSLVQVASHISPDDVFSLSRSSRSLRSVLMSKKAKDVWRAAREHEGAPEPPEGLSEPQCASFFNDDMCSVSSALSLVSLSVLFRAFSSATEARRDCTWSSRSNSVQDASRTSEASSSHWLIEKLTDAPLQSQKRRRALDKREIPM